MASIIYSSPRGSFSLPQGGRGFRRSATKKSRNVSVSCLSSLQLSRDIVQKERQRNQYRGGAGRAAATTTQQQFQGQSKEQENSAFMSDEEIKAQLLESDDTAESNDVEWQIPAYVYMKLFLVQSVMSTLLFYFDRQILSLALLFLN